MFATLASCKGELKLRQKGKSTNKTGVNYKGVRVLEGYLAANTRIAETSVPVSCVAGNT